MGLIPPPRHALADSSHIVSIYYDGQKKVITTDTGKVGDVLRESGVSLAEGDSVEPGVDTALPEGFFNINVYRARPVVVVDGATHHTIKSSSQSPRLVAEAAGFDTYPEDTYTVTALDDPTEFGVVGQKVVINRSLPVTIVDGQAQSVRTQAKTVQELMQERDVAFGPKDGVDPAGTTPITAGMTIHINRVRSVVVTQNDTIARAIKNVSDSSLDAGVTKVETEGQDGVKVSTFKVTYQNGVEQSRELVSSEVTQQAVTKVVRVGTKINYSADPVALGKQLAAQRGWTGDQWTALYNLWDRESGWNPSSHNLFSGACGIPQAYPCSKISDKSPAGQITWGLDYIAGKYGTPANAWAFWLRNHSY